jgi:hypothetical protein
MREKPLFVPLKTEYFRQFESGIKKKEYRRYGPGWNERTCRIGRAVTLSHGYSGARLKGTITGIDIFRARKDEGLDTYGPGAEIIAIAIRLAAPRSASRKTGSRRANGRNRPGSARAAT